jgi:hypothetical protein
VLVGSIQVSDAVRLAMLSSAGQLGAWLFQSCTSTLLCKHTTCRHRLGGSMALSFAYRLSWITTVLAQCFLNLAGAELMGCLG